MIECGVCDSSKDHFRTYREVKCCYECYNGVRRHNVIAQDECDDVDMKNQVMRTYEDMCDNHRSKWVASVIRFAEKRGKGLKAELALEVQDRALLKPVMHR